VALGQTVPQESDTVMDPVVPTKVMSANAVLQGVPSALHRDATSRVAVGATGCCAVEAPTEKNATQPVIAANDKFLIRDLNCMTGFSFVLVVCPPEFPGRSL